MISIPFSRIIASIVYSSAMAFSLVTAHLATPFQDFVLEKKAVLVDKQRVLDRSRA